MRDSLHVGHKAGLAASTLQGCDAGNHSIVALGRLQVPAVSSCHVCVMSHPRDADPQSKARNGLTPGTGLSRAGANGYQSVSCTALLQGLIGFCLSTTMVSSLLLLSSNNAQCTKQRTHDDTQKSAGVVSVGFPRELSAATVAAAAVADVLPTPSASFMASRSAEHVLTHSCND